MNNLRFKIGDNEIGPDTSPYIIAELGINHGGNVAEAHKLLDAAAKCGANAVKLQTYSTARFLARSSAYFDILKSAELPRVALQELVAHATESGVTIFSAVFDEESADSWASLGGEAYKIASGDITHIPLIRHVASFGKPIIISTGGATLDEARRALDAVRTVRDDVQVAFLHCVSNYPTDPFDANLACIATMKNVLQTTVGYSDHTIGTATAIAAVSLGAQLVEKHFTLDRSLPGPDHALSADPQDFAELVTAARIAWQSIGGRIKRPVEAPESINAIRRSVTLTRDVALGVVLERTHLAIKRPGNGISPVELESVIGKAVIRNLKEGHTLTWADLRGNREE